MPNKPNPENVRMIRFKTGYDVLSEMVNDTDPNVIHLINPLSLEVEVDTHTSRQKIFMFPFIPQGIAKTNNCTIDKSEVLFMSELQDDILGYYCKMCLALFSDEAVEKQKEAKRVMDEEMGDKVVSLFKDDSTKLH